MMRACGTACLFLAICNRANALYRPDATDNIVVYYSQNSWGDSHGTREYFSSWQSRLKNYCEGHQHRVFDQYDTRTEAGGQHSFTRSEKRTDETYNLANLDRGKDLCPDGLEYCSNMEEDIETCQNNGKTIVLSIGGEKGEPSLTFFASAEEAKKNAYTIWQMFGPLASENSAAKNRPFGKSAVDGFDLNIEDPNIEYLPEWADEMRKLTKSSNILLTAAVDCGDLPGEGPMGKIISSNVTLNYVNIQFYNSINCWESGENDSEIKQDIIDAWNDWATTNTQWLIGLAAGDSACKVTGCYKDDMTLFNGPKKSSNFGGAMLWDMSQAVNQNFEQKVKNALTQQGDPVSISSQVMTATSSFLTELKPTTNSSGTKSGSLKTSSQTSLCVATG